jgi:hypothetical protein
MDISKNDQRNRNVRGGDNSVDHEVQKLFRKYNGKMTNEDFSYLKQKYSTIEFADNVLKGYLERYHYINKKAKKFAKLIKDKYGNQNYPYHVLLEKAKLFKSKFNLTEDEFHAFQRIYELELIGLKSNEVLIPSTNLSKVLGNVSLSTVGFQGKLNDMDMKALNEIMELHAKTKILHSNVVIQSMQYTDCGFEALSGKFEKIMGASVGDHIHPVIVAMFLPKISTLDGHFLLSNFAGLVSARFNNEPLVSRFDYELLYALTTDPNDIVCHSKSTVTDLLYRARIQNELWECVLGLRTGVYYSRQYRNFLTAIDYCRLNKNDNPDLIYGKFDGIILRRLLSVFSFRPTIVATMPTNFRVALNPYQQNVRPLVTQLPMLYLRLPPQLDDDNNESGLSLQDAVNQEQFFLENGLLFKRQTNVISSRGVLIFYVDRRTNIIKYNAQMVNMLKLPISISGFERINTAEIEYKLNVKVSGDNYALKSVVVAEVSSTQQESDIVIGSSAIVIREIPVSGGIITEKEYFHYDPLRAGTTVEDKNNVWRTGDVISTLEPSRTTTSHPGTSFEEVAKQRGIIFMYKCNNDDRDKNEIPY